MTHIVGMGVVGAGAIGIRGAITPTRPFCAGSV